MAGRQSSPVHSFEQALGTELAEIDQAGLRRQLRRIDAVEGSCLQHHGQWLVQFASNDYLGLASHPALIEAAQEAAARYGAGSTASRLVCGSLAPHHDLEEAIAAWKGTEAALTFSSGFATALGVIPALLGKDDIVIIDKLVHACCVDAARLSGATLRVFRHNDLDHLAEILAWSGKQSGPAGRPRRVLIVTESVFSMDGDLAPLREIVELKDRYGAWLMLDEAHATGVLGAKHCGLAEALGVANRVEIQMGTLSKGMGASGGFVAGRRILADFLINSARSFIFSTAPVPAAAAAAMTAIQLLQSAEGGQIVRRLWDNITGFGAVLSRVAGAPAAPASPIVPLILGAEAAAMEAAAKLRGRGIFAPAIRYPTVPRGKARLRFSISARHQPADFQALEKALGEAAISLPLAS